MRFHKDVVARAEEGFFSLNGRDEQAERWTSLIDFEPASLAGPWEIDIDSVRSQAFRLAHEQQDSLFLGGPCFLGWSKSISGKWVAEWRPLLYREVEVRVNGPRLEVVPKEASWSISPLVFGLLGRMETVFDGSPDQFAIALIERVAAGSTSDDLSLAQRILGALFSELPELEIELSKEARADTFPAAPTSWVMFAPPTGFSALTVHLMRDYERLERLLEQAPTRIGGLRLLEDRAPTSPTAAGDILPVVPLNDSQRFAVRRVVEGRPLTVVSGPPGTGKSQVVVSLLLNAWARGKSVLFASNNNKAVDVVRERVERFESEFPIAVRAGARQKQNIQEVLRRTLNMASIAKDKSSGRLTLKQSKLYRQKLLNTRLMLQQSLNSTLPQRIAEALKTAVREYGEYRSTLASIDVEERDLRSEQARLGFDDVPATALEAAVIDMRAWLARVDPIKAMIGGDDKARAELQSAVLEFEHRRNRAGEEIGLSARDAGDWAWLLSGPSSTLVTDWAQRIRELLASSIEQALEPIEWSDAFDQWRSEADSEAWQADARAFADLVLRTNAELAPKLHDLRALSESLEEARAKMQALAIPNRVDVDADALRDWESAFGDYATLEAHALDFLPWSRQSILRRALRRLEHRIRPGFPLSLWTRIGPLNDKGRAQLAPVLEATRGWISLSTKWESFGALREDLDERFRQLRARAAALRLNRVPTDQDAAAWIAVVAECETTATIADRATLAWRRRTAKEEAETRLRTIAKEWLRLASGVPIRAAWSRGQGAQFDHSLQQLAERPDPETLAAVRSALYTGKLDRLIDSWRGAAELDRSAAVGRLELNGFPSKSDRVRSWWQERPRSAFTLVGEATDEWPDLESATSVIADVAAWTESWKLFINSTRPQNLLLARKQLEWALTKLAQAVAILPEGKDRVAVEEIFERLRQYPDEDWPVEALNDSFAGFNPERITAKIERLEAELERGAFDDAKSRWLQRLRDDDDAIRAVDALEKSLRQNRGRVVESQFDTFRTALRVVPIWITTAQASQSIPLEPDLFDIVIIDEASQCTLTNLLPLMFRGRTLAVIGDENQLPAIPTIQESEELALARKYGIEDHLGLVGHATNDVYRSAAESLPRRRADVVMLQEHYRSHPQIIGFANRHIYLQRLELKKNPNWGERLPVGSGVHVRSVAGIAARGQNGRSWVNMPEADAVVAAIQELRSGDSRTLSLGVVTPFAAQKELLRERLDALHLASEVVVDTAYGFQGDERDIMIFSPVVAKGITTSASRWVEKPPNLINVSITRAREALFMIGDIDYCLQQEGILRKLALYCRDIQLLRETSAAELELFSWMMVKAWVPKVHPRIGDIEVDFVLGARSGGSLVIEVDGGQHADSTAQDKARDAFLQAQGHTVLRFRARDVLETPFDVMHQIELRVDDTR